MVDNKDVVHTAPTEGSELPTLGPHSFKTAQFDQVWDAGPICPLRRPQRSEAPGFRLPLTNARPSMVLDVEGSSQRHPVLALDDRRHLRALPIRLDPPRSLVGPCRRRAAPMAAHHEPREQLPASVVALRLSKLPQPRDRDLPREQKGRSARVRRGKQLGAMGSSRAAARAAAASLAHHGRGRRREDRPPLRRGRRGRVQDRVDDEAHQLHKLGCSRIVVRGILIAPNAREDRVEVVGVAHVERSHEARRHPSRAKVADKRQVGDPGR